MNDSNSTLERHFHGGTFSPVFEDDGCFVGGFTCLEEDRKEVVVVAVLSF